MTGVVRFGVLGCASFAWRRMLPALRAHPRTEVAAVASREPAKAARFAAEFRCAATGYDELLGRDDIDVVYLPLPLALRPRWIEAALRAGKHVLAEKPLALRPWDARRLVRLAANHGLLLRDNFLFPHHPQHAQVRELLAAGRLGRLRAFHGSFCIPPLPPHDVRYRRELGGGALLDVGVYPLRAAQLLLGGDIRVVGASLLVDDRRGVDVAGQALLVTKDGVLATIGFGFEHSYECSYSLHGTAAAARLDRAYTPPADWRPVLRIEDEAVPLEPADQIAAAVGSFADAVLAGRSARHPAEARWCAHAVRTVELAEQVREMAITGGWRVA
ncbi:NDP-hexose-3-ketoreductase [Kutzneria buriramensis]|uniref:NDP-hexose-3-ketoreductase n=1 Tax=Kutzneria buriramensis TaxID=1045776 RepID=A0A3E0H1R5_9PSEU|nr:NDP-hexose-3-ketoreductase [Kutzneria buriramensis]